MRGYVVLLALVAGVLIAISPAAADPPAERSPLENPEPVEVVRLQLDGSEMLDEVNDAGFDLSGGVERVPTGVEVDAVVSDAAVTQLEAMGADVLPQGEGFEWSWARDGGFASTFGARSLVAPDAQDTVRVARADWY